MSAVPLRTDEQRLQLHLDAEPGDTVTRLVLADLLEEQGRDEEAKAQRLLAEMKLWPDNDLAFKKKVGWHWWIRASGKHGRRKHAKVPEDAQRHMPDGEWIYQTRLEAEAVFLQALRDAAEL